MNIDNFTKELIFKHFLEIKLLLEKKACHPIGRIFDFWYIQDGPENQKKKIGVPLENFFFFNFSAQLFELSGGMLILCS